MAYFRTSLTTEASADAAFDYLADFSNARLWDPTVVRARRLTRDAIGLGSRFEVVLGLAGRESRLEYRITGFDPGRRLVLRAETPFLRSVDTIEFQSRPGGCRIQYDADLRLKGVAYLLDLPVHLAFQASGVRSVGGLQRALDGLSRRDLHTAPETRVSRDSDSDSSAPGAAA